MVETAQPALAARLKDVSHAHRGHVVLDRVSLSVPAGRITCIIGPDGAGKSSLLSLVAGISDIQAGEVMVLGGDIHKGRHRRNVLPAIGYVPQDCGANLHPALSVLENADFFGRMFGLGRAERHANIRRLIARFGFHGLEKRRAGGLSDGMRQKLGLCCALIHDPDLLILDEPTAGLDSLSRRQFWEMIGEMRADRPGLSLLVATNDMQEAARFDWLAAMKDGRLVATGSSGFLLSHTGTETLDDALAALMKRERIAGPLLAENVPSPAADSQEDLAIEADGLVLRFGDLTAVDEVGFQIRRGEIFGLTGSNGSGKSSVLRILAGLQSVTQGSARILGTPADRLDAATRRRVGHVGQSSPLYPELTVRQNLALRAKLHGLPGAAVAERIEDIGTRLQLGEVMDRLPDTLSPGLQKRVSLAAALIHAPDVLILDEPTSGVDPIARKDTWDILIELARRDGVAILISTHDMSEADRCDRLALMHAGRILACDTPQAIRESRQADTLEEAFIGHVTDAIGPPVETRAKEPPAFPSKSRAGSFFSPRRMLGYGLREMLELRRDPIRAILGLIGGILFMLVAGYGINLDAGNLAFAVLDRDDTTASREYAAEIAGSRYFTEQPPLADQADLDQRMRDGSLKLAIEIPAGFAGRVATGREVVIDTWIGGMMPIQTETVRSHLQGIHDAWLARKARDIHGDHEPGQYSLETRFHHNPGAESPVATVPAVITLLLLLIPAMLAALSLARDRQNAWMSGFAVSPATKLEFLLGKQLPYLAIGLANAALLWLCAVFVFSVPFTGSLALFAVSAFFYVMFATAAGQLIASLLSGQTKVMLGIALICFASMANVSGLIDSLSSMARVGVSPGEFLPANSFEAITMGTFARGAGFEELRSHLVALAVAGPALMLASILFLKKRAR